MQQYAPAVFHRLALCTTGLSLLPDPHPQADFKIERGMRLVVRGPNGAGKSTLVKALAGTLPLSEGKRIEDDRLALGYFTQDLAQDLDQSRVAIELVMEEVRKYDPLLPDSAGRAVLGALGLRGEMVMRRIGDLSGGEKARVALGIFCLVPHNVLVLDEPSNHLDVGAIKALETALAKYTGTIVVISHDRPFCEALSATHVAYVIDGGVKMEERPLRDSDWVATSTVAIEDENVVAAAAVAADSSAAAAAPVDPEARRRAGKAPGMIKKLEAKIGDAEGKMAALDEEMMEKGSDLDFLKEAGVKREELQGKVDAFYEEYEELELLLEQFPDVKR